VRIAQFLSELRQEGVQLWIENGRVRYRAPKGVLTPERMAILVRQEDEILAHLPRPRNYPLSFLQEGIWYQEQLQLDVPAYNMLVAWRMYGAVKFSALERSFNAIVQRHDTLRTHFDVIEEQPVQVVTPELQVRLRVMDLSHFQEAEREEKAMAQVKAEASWTFDLRQAPLLRVSLIRLARTENVLILNMHHLIGDGWSFGILMRELSAFYAAFSRGRPAPNLAALPIQYGEFAARHRERPADDGLQPQRAYWCEKLRDAPPLLELHADGIRPPVPGYEGGRVSMVLPQSLTQILTELNRREGVTLFMMLLAAFKLLLQRTSGQDDIVVGTPVINRDVETEGLIGLFLNNLVLRTDLSGEITFRELLGLVRETVLGAFDNKDLPFEKLVQVLRPERNPSYTPLFQVFINMYMAGEAEKPELEGLTTEIISPEEIESGSKFDITLYIRERFGTIHCSLAYKISLFHRQRMVEMLAQYAHLLDQIAKHPDRKLDEYSLVTSRARQLLPDPGEVLPEPPQELLTSMLARQAERAPHRTAVCQGDRTWTYGELLAKGAALARRLRAEGISRGDAVAVSATRCFALIVCMLGVSMGGAVLVPLDPHIPGKRKHLILREANAKRLLSVEGKEDEDAWLLEDPAAPIVLRIEASTGQVIGAAFTTDASAIPLPQVSPEDPAYIFFTSGTTGTPKGVLGCQKSLSHFLQWQGEMFEITEGDRAAQLTGLSFDVVLRDVFLALTRGATLCLPDAAGEEHFDVLRWLNRERITLLHTVPTLAHSWLEGAAAGTVLPHLRLTFFAGEPLTDTLVRQWRAMFPSCEIVNLYGATETTLAKCYYRIPADLKPGVQPLGRTLPQTQVLVLAENRRLCGINEPGEIVIRTPFRTRGYINLPEENVRCFIRNPFREDERDLLYLTGDRGRFRSDGQLEILGRLDDQVKIRGVRVEPDEVAVTLARHPQVQTCAVIPQIEERGQVRLVAFVVPRVSGAMDASNLRAHLGQMLPAAMVPEVFVQVDRLPFGPNGKIDRCRLPFPEPGALHRETEFLAPSGPVEELFAGVWREVLMVDRIGARDNFFELGGHSLAAMRIVSRLRYGHGISISLRQLFELPTIAELAAIVGDMRRDARDVTGWDGQDPRTPDQQDRDTADKE
jgi:amino acid adenylation domain-containing protein